MVALDAYKATEATSARQHMMLALRTALMLALMINPQRAGSDACIAMGTGKTR